MKTYEYEILNERRWEHPSDYGGFSPDGDVVIAVQTRDSDALERSNYRQLMAYLESIAAPLQSDDDEPYIYDFRAGHWAVGWVETLLMTQQAPDELQRAVVECLAALADYPVFDESDYSQLEFEEVGEYWESLTVGDRVEIIQKYGGSIFAARHDYINEHADPSGMVFDYLRTP